MKIVFIDFETYYSDTYSLKYMTVPEYIYSPEFELIGAAVIDGGDPYWVEGPDFATFLSSLPKDCVVVSHNYLFDGCILAWRYGFVPKLASCTLSISRATLGHKLRSLALGSVAAHLGLGVKDKAALAQVKGMNLQMIKNSPSLFYERYRQYACDDARMCKEIFERLVPKEFPIEELAVLDMTLRCALISNFRVNKDLLALHLAAVIATKQNLLASVGADKGELMSNDKFAGLLEGLGVTPPTKISVTTGKEAYAFAKTDVAFLDLLEHQNPSVQALVAARLGNKSTLEETRTAKFINVANVTPQSSMPIPLAYGAAHTHRLGGEWKLNFQNLPRNGNLRASLVAPDGYQVVKVDASQIEARITAWFSGCKVLVEQFARGEDVYASFASSVWGRQINKQDYPEERWIGKSAVLGLGFGMGWGKFQKTLKSQSEGQLGKRITLSDEVAQKIVNTYRNDFAAIPVTWRLLSNMLPLLAGETTTPHTWGPLVFDVGKITLPSITGEIGKGLTLKYHKLHRRDDSWAFEYGGKPKYLFGGKLMENIAQALDRVLVMGAALRLQKRLAPMRLALQAHDENVYIVPDAAVDVVKTILLQEMSRRPPWGLDLPLAAEAASGPNYRDVR